MNPTPPDDSALELLLRARAGRLAAPDPAWREGILTACESAAPAAPGSPCAKALTASNPTAFPTFQGQAQAQAEAQAEVQAAGARTPEVFTPAATGGAGTERAVGTLNSPMTRHRKPWLKLPRGAASWGSLAACWLAVLVLNHETRQLNAGVSPLLPASGSSELFSGPLPGGSLFLQQADMAMLTLLQPPRPRRPAPATPSAAPQPPKLPPHQSFNVPAFRPPALIV